MLAIVFGMNSAVIAMIYTKTSTLFANFAIFVFNIIAGKVCRVFHAHEA